MLSASRFFSALCSSFAPGHDVQPCNRVQGFGKAKNRVGMARPKNQKLEVVETTAEIGTDADCDTGVTGEQQPRRPLCAKEGGRDKGPDRGAWQEAVQHSAQTLRGGDRQCAGACSGYRKGAGGQTCPAAPRCEDAAAGGWRQAEASQEDVCGAAKRTYEAIIG